jgi:hypothetical protein
VREVCASRRTAPGRRVRRTRWNRLGHRRDQPTLSACRNEGLERRNRIKCGCTPEYTKWVRASACTVERSSTGALKYVGELLKRPTKLVDGWIPKAHGVGCNRPWNISGWRALRCHVHPESFCVSGVASDPKHLTRCKACIASGNSFSVKRTLSRDVTCLSKYTAFASASMGVAVVAMNRPNS